MLCYQTRGATQTLDDPQTNKMTGQANNLYVQTKLISKQAVHRRSSQLCEHTKLISKQAVHSEISRQISLWNYCMHLHPSGSHWNISPRADRMHSHMAVPRA